MNGIMYTSKTFIFHIHDIMQKIKNMFDVFTHICSVFKEWFYLCINIENNVVEIYVNMGSDF